MDRVPGTPWLNTMDEPRRILVIHVTRIGDTLLTTPVLRALSVAWPNAEITFAGHRKRIEVMRNLPFIHRLRNISKYVAPFLGRIGRRHYELALVYGQDEPLVEYALRVADKVIAMRQKSDSINRRLLSIGSEDGYRPRDANALTQSSLHLIDKPQPASQPADFACSRASSQETWKKWMVDRMGSIFATVLTESA